MKKNLAVAFLTLVVVILASLNTGYPSLATSTSSQDNAVVNEFVFSIPVGDNGIHYENVENPDILTWGPSAFTVAPDGTFWIADTPDDHLLHFSSNGELLDKITIKDFVIGAGDLEVTSKEIWILDMASIPPKIVHLSLNGKILSTHNLPSGFYLEDGLSGIAVSNDGSVLIERMGGHIITRFLSSSGEIEQKALEGYESQDKTYSAYPADLRFKENASYGYILAGNKRIDVKVDNDLGDLSILYITPEGDLFVKVAELVLNTTFQVDQKVYRYNPSGNLVGMARIPLALQYTYVAHGIAVGPDGEVYALITRPDIGEIQKLTFNADLSPVLTPSEALEEYEKTQVYSPAADTCRPRESVIDVASDYRDNSTYLDSYHINDNAICTERVKPRYLGGAGTYSSIPYAWNMWDTVDQFNAFMSGGQNGYFAGNISVTYENCARGIDCSGLVSRAWDLGSHYGTCSLESISIALSNVYALQSGDIMNRCFPTPRHTIIFDRFEFGGMRCYEATTEFDYDRVVRIYRSFESIAAYIPRRYNNVCNQIHLPVVNNAVAEMNSVSPSSDPYPPPSLYQSPNPYP